MSDHTKGTWEIEHREGHSQADFHTRPVICANGQRVAIVSRSGAPNHSEVEMLANANILAAAPDLYETLSMLIGYHYHNDSGVKPKEYHNAMAALNKAQGLCQKP